jgi:hypothetical protein
MRPPPSRAPRATRSRRSARFPQAEVVFVDLVAARAPNAEPPIFDGLDIGRVSVVYPTRASSLPRLAARKLATRWQRIGVRRATGQVREGVFGDRVQGLHRVLKSRRGRRLHRPQHRDAAAGDAAAGERGRVVFDCMEYYSDMGDGQVALEARAARVLEAMVPA